MLSIRNKNLKKKSVSFLSASMQANIISLLEEQEAMTEVENCSFHNALGLTRDCYLCRKYNTEKIELRVCKPDESFDSHVRGNSSLKLHYIEKLIHSIDLYCPDKTVFITAIGIRKLCNMCHVTFPTAIIFCDFLIRKEIKPSNEIGFKRSDLTHQLCKNFSVELDFCPDFFHE